MSNLSKRSTVYFEPEIHQALRLKAASSNLSISELIDESRQFNASKIFKVPEEAYFINVSLLLRTYHAKHALTLLEVRQLKKTQIYYGILFLLVCVPVIAE